MGLGFRVELCFYLEAYLSRKLEKKSLIDLDAVFVAVILPFLKWYANKQKPMILTIDMS